MVRRKVCVGRMWVARSVVLAGGHRRRPVVVQVPRRVVGQMVEAIQGGTSRGRQWIHVPAPTDVHRAALHARCTVGSPVALKDMGFILGRCGVGRVLLRGGTAFEWRLVVRRQSIGILVGFAEGRRGRGLIAGGHGM